MDGDANDQSRTSLILIIVLQFIVRWNADARICDFSNSNNDWRRYTWKSHKKTYKTKTTMPGPYDSSGPNKAYHCDQKKDKTKGDLSSFPGRHDNLGIPMRQVWHAPHYTDVISPYATTNPAFPIKLHHCLAETKKEGLEHIVSWMPHGRAFKVHDKDAFVKSILPCFFSQSSYESFQRQLNLYNFTRITGGKATYHIYASF